MLRALVLILLLANALVLAGSLGMLEGLLGRSADADREPQRLQRQVRPELVRLLPPEAASAALAAASAPPPAASAVPVALCLEAGPLPPAALPGAEKALLAASVPAGSWTTVAADRKGLYLIYMGRYDDEETLQRKMEEVKRRRIEVQVVRNADLRPGLEIGRFDDKAEAEATLARLSQRGLRTARVLTVSAPQPQWMLRLASADPAQAEALAALQLAPGVGGFAPCAAAEAPASSAPPASAAPSAATPARTPVQRPRAPASPPASGGVAAASQP